ncbi:MBL fold metallo-hydrolase [Alphaproteobacteria bacterium]|nr:MBL fold metallo-hydrolase [Alphaproteobacteria bacterium]
MDIKFLGVRGSTPALTKKSQIFGHHTPAIQIVQDETVLFLDAGTGLGNSPLLSSSSPLSEIHLFLSHFHLDHLAGLPFSPYFWQQDKTVHIWSAALDEGHTAEETLNTLFAPPFFPIPFKKWGATFVFHQIASGETTSIHDQIQVSAYGLHHPGGALGYRLENKNGRIFAYVTDVEHGDATSDQHIKKLMHQADLAMFDGMFDEQSYASHKGWGHATWEKGVQFAQQAQVKQFALMHHPYSASDEDLLKRDKKVRSAMPGAFLAREGQVFKL